MIKLGDYKVSMYPKHGVVINNNGTIIFHGPCHLSSGTTLSVTSTGLLEFGKDVIATAELHVACYYHVNIKDKVLFGRECTIMDTNFHRLSDINDSTVGKTYSEVEIGEESWIGFKVSLMPGAVIPPRCVIASNSMLNKNYKAEPYSLFAGVPAKVVKEGVWRNPKFDNINYIKYGSN